METQHRAIVTAVRDLTPRLRRVELAVPEGTWKSTGIPDEFVHLEVGAESLDADGHSSRHYSIARLLPHGVAIDVVLHGHGPGAKWGREAVTGDVVYFSDAHGYYKPSGSGTRILAGDMTAIPAIRRILAEASADEVFRVIVEIPDMGEASAFNSDAEVHTTWVVSGNHVSASTLQQSLSEVLSASDDDHSTIYIWVACESAVSRSIRQHLRQDLGIHHSRFRIVGYWHSNVDKMREIWASMTDEQRSHYESIWRDDRSDEENWLELEPFLKSVGL